MKSTAESAEDDDKCYQISPAKLAFKATRIAAAQICQSVGYRSAQRSALDTLADTAARYLRALAESAAAFAVSSCRTQCNLFDVVIAIERLSSVRGFPGASDLNNSLISSSILIDLARFVNFSPEIPFAQIFRRSYPMVVAPPPRPPGGSCNSVASLSHIPRWLPAIPDMDSRKDKEKRREIEFGFEEEVDGCLDGGKMRREKGIDGGGFVDSEEIESGLIGRKMGIELGTQRRRVRFKIGVREMKGEKEIDVDLRSGICRGGKWVSCQNTTKTIGWKER